MNCVQPIEAGANRASVTEAAKPAAEPSSFVRRLMLATGWPMHLVSLALLLQICRLARFPTMRLGALGWYLLWIGLMCIWLTIRVTLWALYRSETIMRRPWHWLVSPVLLIMGFVLPISGLPCRWTFNMNRPAFDRLAQQVMASPSSLHAQSVGPYDTSQTTYTEPTPGSKAGAEVVITLSRTGKDLSNYGFAYHPDGLPHSKSDKDFGGGWYTWTYTTQ